MEPLSTWLRSLMCSARVIRMWSEYTYDRRDSVSSMVCLFDNILHAPVNFVLTKDYAEFFGRDLVQLHIPRALPIIGQKHHRIMQLLYDNGDRCFESGKFVPEGEHMRWTGFIFDRAIADHMPREQIVRRLCAQVLVSAHAHRVYGHVLQVLLVTLAQLRDKRPHSISFLVTLHEEIVVRGLYDRTLLQYRRYVESRETGEDADADDRPRLQLVWRHPGANDGLYY